MALRTTHQFIEIDPDAPFTNVDLDITNKIVTASIVTNTVVKDKRLISLVVVFDDAIVDQHSISVEFIRLAVEISNKTNEPINDAQTMVIALWLPMTVGSYTKSETYPDGLQYTDVALITISHLPAAQANTYTDLHIGLNPEFPATTPNYNSNPNIIGDSASIYLTGLQPVSGERGAGVITVTFISVAGP